MKELVLVKQTEFEGAELDCYVDPTQQDKGNFWATREQIGRLLEYENPRKAIKDIHERHRERLDKFSTVVKLPYPVRGAQNDTPLTNQQDTTIYNFKGLLEICRYSNQPKANAVMDWLWEVADEIRRTGAYSLKKKRAVTKKKPAPSLKSIMDACEIIYDLALHCENNNDVQKVLAMDEVFKRSVGDSALEMAHFNLKCQDNYGEELSLEFKHPELELLRSINKRIQADFNSSEYLNLIELWKCEGQR